MALVKNYLKNKNYDCQLSMLLIIFITQIYLIVKLQGIEHL